jgi:quinol-cytochrome oxidoreductase complex cytochrome b subunit
MDAPWNVLGFLLGVLMFLLLWCLYKLIKPKTRGFTFLAGPFAL